MMIQGHDFLPAVGILEKWLMEYSRELGRRTPSAHSAGEYPLQNHLFPLENREFLADS